MITSMDVNHAIRSKLDKISTQRVLVSQHHLDLRSSEYSSRDSLSLCRTVNGSINMKNVRRISLLIFFFFASAESHGYFDYEICRRLNA